MWINVNEILPELGGEVLVFAPTEGHHPPSIYVAEYSQLHIGNDRDPLKVDYGVCFHTISDFFQFARPLDVTHWQLLPDKPKQN